jgi:acyl carrier protein
MGMESVKIVMSVEEAFRINISDAEAESILTPRHLIELVMAKVVQSQPGQWSRQQVAEKIHEIVIEVLACEKQYREDAEFVKDLGMG